MNAALSYCKGCFLLGCLLHSLLAKAQVDTLARLAPDRRIVALLTKVKSWKANKQIAINAESNLRQLDSVRLLARRQGDQRLLWYVDLQRILCQAVAEGRTQKSITAFADAESYMEQCPQPVVRASYYFHYGKQLFDDHQLDQGLKLLFRAQRLFEGIGYKNIPEANQYLNGFGNMYYALSDFRKSAQCLELCERSPNRELVDSYYTWNTLGLAYKVLKQYSKAEQAFRRVIVLAKAAHDTDYVGLGSGNLGALLRGLGKNREALPYLYTDFTVSEKTLPSGAAIACLIIAKSLLALDSVAKAKFYIDYTNQLQPNGVKLIDPINYYETMTLYYKKTGDYAKAAIYLDSLVTRKDLQLARRTDKALATTENSIKADQYIGNIEQAEREKKWTTTIRSIVIVTLVLLTLAVIYSINQKRRQMQQEQRLRVLLGQRAEAERTYAQTQLHQYLGSIRDKHELISHISTELENPRRDDTNSNSSLVQNERMLALFDSVSLNDKDWLQFQHLFEQAYPDFFKQLKQDYPDLRLGEIRLLALVKLNISTKEIGLMLGISAASVRKLQYRLRKKLDDGQADNALLELI